MSTDAVELAVCEAIKAMLDTVASVGMTAVAFVMQMQTLAIEEIPPLLDNLREQTIQWSDGLEEFERAHRQLLLEDEKNVAASGGRDNMRNGLIAVEQAMPVSAALQIGRAHSMYLLALLTSHQRVWESLVEQEADIPRARWSAAKIFKAAVARLDEKIDLDLCTLTWEVASSAGLVRDDPEVQARGLRTCSDIVDTVNYMRLNWRAMDAMTAPVEAICQVLTLAIGRLSLRVLPQSGTILRRTNPYPASSVLVDVDIYTGQSSQLASAVFADMWLCLGSMQHNRWIVLHSLQIQREEDLYKTWQDVLANGHTVLPMTVTDAGDVVQLLSKPLLMEWARSVARVIANEDRVMTAILRVMQTNSLMIGDRLLHAAYRPAEDRTVSAVLKWRDSDRQIRWTLGDSPRKILEGAADPDKEIAVGECMMQLIDYLNQNYGDEKSVRELCLYRQDSIEKLGVHAAAFVIPVILQVHGQWVVTIEGSRTPPCTFTHAVMIWMRMCLLAEKNGVAVFRLSPVARLMTEWLRQEQEHAAAVGM